MITKEKWLENTANHTMQILHDDGIYRHLVFSNNGSSFYKYHIVTTPGHLIYYGDVGAFIFRRIEDMIYFFNGDKINPHYWAEKLEAGEWREFNYKVFVGSVLDILNEIGEDESFDDYRSALEDVCDEWEAVAWARDHAFIDSDSIYSALDHSYDYTQRYLWACYAIQHGCNEYLKFKGE